MLEDLSFDKQVSAVADGECLSYVMVGDKYPDVLEFQFRNNTLDILNGDRIDTSKRLVEKNEFRIHSQCSGDLGPSSFSTTQYITIAFSHMLQAKLVEQ